MTDVNAVPPARPHSDALLTSLAIINVNWQDNRQSYLDNFVPFALEAMRRTKRDEYTTAEVQEEMAAAFGLDLPAQIVESLLGRATRQNILTRDRRRYRFDNGGGENERAGIARQQADLGRRHMALVAQLVRFAQERFGIDWPRDAAEEALLGHVERQAIPLLASAVEGKSYVPHADKQGRDYIVSTFVVELFESDPQGFEHIEALVKGCMLSSALYVGAPGNSPRKFRDTTLYLDTPVCLKALGHEGAEARTAVQETLRLAVSQGARLACFEHSVREMEGVLESAKAAIRRAPGSEGHTRGVAEHFYKGGFTENDINAKIARIDNDLESARIKVIAKPEHEIARTVDEVALETLMQERVGYARRNTLEYDLDSLTAIHRLRGGQSSQHLETCRAVLITDNYALVGAARTFFKGENHRWPVAMPEHGLAALVWVKEPLSAPDLPKQQIIADCYAALAPTQSHWERIVAEIERLQARGDITDDEVGLLIHSNEAQRSLMDTTLGDPSKVDERAIKVALASTKQEIERPAKDARDSALARASKAEAAEVSERFERQQAEAEVEDLRAAVARFEGREARQRQHIETQAERTARRWERLVVLVVGALILFGLLSPVIPNVNDWLSGLAAKVLFGVVVGTAVLAGIALISGWNLKDWIRPHRERLRRGLIARAFAKQGMLEDDPA